MTVIIARAELPTDGPKVAPTVPDNQHNALLSARYIVAPIGSMSQL